MKTMKDYLSKGARALVDESNEVRIEAIRKEKWIDYPGATEILSDWEELLVYPKRDRMPCRLLIAETNNGKSSLIRKFLRTHPADPNLGGDAVNIPVLFAILNGPDPKQLCRQLLSSLFEEIPKNPKTGDLTEQLISVLKRVKPKMIILDQANTLISSSPAKTRACFDTLKFIVNSTGIPVVAVGTKEALHGFRSDEQMENRFEPRRLELWKSGTALQSLLIGFEMLTPLKNPSGLSSAELSNDILHRTGGYIGEMATLITKAATLAIKSGEEKITAKILNECGYVGVAKRKSMR